MLLMPVWLKEDVPYVTKNIITLVVVEFNIAGEYSHSEPPPMNDCARGENDEYICYLYKCQQCEHYIVAYKIPKA